MKKEFEERIKELEERLHDRFIDELPAYVKEEIEESLELLKKLRFALYGY